MTIGKAKKFNIKKFMKKYQIPNAFYRVSVKGLILDETRKKFLVIQEDNKWWELPGGGNDSWGESPEEALKREIKEEMGLTVTKVNPDLKYYIIFNKKKTWIINLVFEVKVKNLNFTPTYECQKIQFISPKDINKMNVFGNVKKLAKLFNSKK